MDHGAVAALVRSGQLAPSQALSALTSLLLQTCRLDTCVAVTAKEEFGDNKEYVRLTDAQLSLLETQKELVKLLPADTQLGTQENLSRWFEGSEYFRCVSLGILRLDMYPHEDEDSWKLLQAAQQHVSQALSAAAIHLDQSFVDILVRLCTDAIQSHCQIRQEVEGSLSATATPQNGTLNPLGVGTLTRCLLENDSSFARLPNDLVELVFSWAVGLVDSESRPLRHMAVNHLLPLCLNRAKTNGPTRTGSMLKAIWDKLQSMQGLTGLPRRNAFAVLCSLYEALFADDVLSAFDLRTDDQFWSLVQGGLLDTESLTRKRSLYLLKRVVATTERQCVGGASIESRYFRWNADQSKGLAAMWETFCVVYETSFETQVHVIEPTLEMMPSLFSDAATFGLDFSWISLLYKAQFSHENRRVQKLALLTVLNTDVRRHPAIIKTEEFLSFVFGPLFAALNETTVYYTNDAGDPKKDAVTAMPIFFQALLDIVEDRARFASLFLCGLADHHFDSAPLAYAACTLAKWPRIDAWGPKELSQLQHVLQVTMRTHHRQIRSISQEKLLTAFTLLLDQGVVGVQDVVNTVAAFTADQALSTGRPMWTALAAWLPEVTVRGGDGKQEPLPVALARTVKDFLAPDSGNTDRVSHIALLGQEASALALSSSLLCLAPHTSQSATEFYSHLIKATGKLVADLTLGKEVTIRCLVLLASVLRDHQHAASVDPKYQAICTSLMESLRAHSSALIGYLLRMVFDETAYKKVDDCLLVETYASLLGSLQPLMDSTILNGWIARSCDILKASANERKLQQQLHKIGACVSLCAIAEKGNLYDVTTVQTVLSAVQHAVVHKPTDVAVGMGDWGHATDSFQMAKWSTVDMAVAYLEKSNTLQVDSCRQTLELCVDALETVSPATFFPLFRCIGRLTFTLASQKPVPESDVVLIGQAVSCAWESLCETLNEGAFFTSLEAFTEMVFQPALLAIPDLACEGGVLQEHALKIVGLGVEKQGVVYAMAERCCRWWKTGGVQAMGCANEWTGLVVQWVMYGEKRKSTKHENRIIDRFYRDFNKEPSIQNRHDFYVRTVVNSFLLQLQPAESHQAEFARKLLHCLFDENGKQDKARISVGHTDTPEHRYKVRMWQTILLLAPFVRGDEAETRLLLPRVMDALKPEHLWSSARIVVEWMAIFLLSALPTCVDVVLAAMESTSAKAGADCSFVQILFRVCNTLPSGEPKVAFCEHVMPKFYGYSLSNHYTVRAFAQHAIISLAKEWKGTGTDLYTRYYSDPQAQATIHFLETNKDIIKHRAKLAKDYFISKFDPVKDFTVQFLFGDMLEMCGVLADEQHGAVEFREISGLSRFPFMGMDADTHVDWRQENYTDLRTNWRGYERDALKSQQQAEAQPQGADADIDGGRPEDVQKKIMPWEQLLAGDSEYSELTRLTVDSRQDRPKDRSLIVVASLIDKIPNLGGLCRTCEIFAASRLVFDNVGVLESPEFKTLARTAEKWLPIDQVKQADLAEYLIAKKAEGYSLIGVEQTAGSVDLTSFRFPLKSVLVLGREREGVPVELIQLLDMCVEIPQLGTIRSLNVHVSGALLIWEYTRQCILPAMAGSK